MRISRLNHNMLGTAIAAALAIGIAAAAPSPLGAQTAEAPDGIVTLSVGEGRLVRLNSPMSDLFVADDKIADVQVRSPSVLYIFGKGAGTTTISATNKAGRVVFSTNVRVGANLAAVGDMLKMAMPEAAITATPMNGMVLLTGTVATPSDLEEAQALVQAFVGDATKVISRLKTATPMQVNLRVRIAEVNREYVKNIGVNLANVDLTGGFLFNIIQGRQGAIDLTPPTFGLDGALTERGKIEFGGGASGTTLGLFGNLFGLDIAAALDLAENDGFASTLAEPNLTALSGETASFLAGGEIPIPVPQFQGVTTIEYKQYGVSLAFTPVVLSNGRISMRVRPEVSELAASTVSIGGFEVPGLITRRTETTVELGSGQSFVIGGLMTNRVSNSINKAPFLGDIPILGALFKSQGYRRNETELVIVVTPYLVKPIDAGRVALPTDGYRAPSDATRLLAGQGFEGRSGDTGQRPRALPPVTVPPATRRENAAAKGDVQPGFSIN